MARKGFYEELQKVLKLKELTVKLVDHANKVMNSDDDVRKDKLTEKLLPKIVDKAIPSQLTGEDGGDIVLKIVNYSDNGDNPTLQIPAQTLPTQSS